MAKVREELRDALVSKPHPDESDIDRLPYLRAVVMEYMRLHPPSPLLMPHEAMADGVEVGCFTVPAGTKVGGTDVDFRSKRTGGWSSCRSGPGGGSARACPWRQGW
jgi:hypothetical protein